MDIKRMDLIAEKHINEAFRITRTELRLNKPHHIERLKTFLDGDSELRQARELLTSALNRYIHLERLEADPDAEDLQAGGPALAPQKPNEYAWMDHAKLETRVFKDNGYSRRVVGITEAGLSVEAVIQLLKRRYDTMPFGHRDFTYSPTTGKFGITIHTD